MNDGFIRLSRRFFNNEYWQQQRTYSSAEAWIDLIWLARFEGEPKVVLLPNGRRITLQRGEIHASIRFLATRWNWGTDKVKRFVDYHVAKNEIIRRVEQSESVLKLSNYELYNPVSVAEPNTDQTVTDTPTDTVTSTPTDTNTKKVKKDNNPPNPPLQGGGSKQKPKKPPKEPPAEPGLNSKARLIFEEHYLKTFQSDYYWTAKDAGNMSGLLKKLVFSRQKKNLDCSDDEVLAALKFFLERIKGKWVSENFSVSIINSKFNELITQIRNEQTTRRKLKYL